MLDLKNINLKNIGLFRFKEFNGKFLLTNDAGDYIFLSKEIFGDFISGKLKKETEIYSQLENKGFIRNDKEPQKLIEKFHNKNFFLGAGPVLHIIVATLRCNQQCIYCHASAVPTKEKDYDLDIETAKKIVDTIFCAPARNLTIEFQGGEPLLNWEVIKFVIEYAKEKEKIEGKHLHILLVSNLLLITKDKLEFLIKNEVGICTSLDGPMVLHNKNRGSYQTLIKNIKMVMQEYKEKFPVHLPSGIVTITKQSLPYYKEIVDEYIKLGFEGVFIRPVNPIGYAQDLIKEINYTVEEYIDFYKKTIDYIIEINKKTGKTFFEHTAIIFLVKMLKEQDPNFMDMRSPCGAGIGQITYNYNGDVYTCDEGRMLSRMGDESFKMGNIMENSYSELIDNAVVKACCVASCLDGLPFCINCVYKPYCGTCPVLNYVEKGDIFMKSVNNKKCMINKSIFDYLFEKILNEENLNLFTNWVK